MLLEWTALNCFLQLLHCLKDPSFAKFIVLLEEQNIQCGENRDVNSPFIIYELNVWY